MDPMKKTKSNSLFVDLFDIYGNSFNLRVFGQEKYKTIVGSIMGILSMMAIVSISAYFINDLFQRNSMTLIYNKDSSLIPVINLTDVPVLVVVTNKAGQWIDSKGVYNFDVKMLNYKTDLSIGKLHLNITPIEVEPCNLNTSFNNHQDLFEALPLTQYSCIQPGKYDKTLHGKFGDIANGFSLFAIFVNKCDPKIQICKNATYIDAILADSVLSITYLSYNIDHYNTTKPNSYNIVSAIFPVSSSIIKSYCYNLAQIIYYTDYGFIFEVQI